MFTSGNGTEEESVKKTSESRVEQILVSLNIQRVKLYNMYIFLQLGQFIVKITCYFHI